MPKVWWGEAGKADQTHCLEYLLTFARHHGLKVTSGEYIDAAGHPHYHTAGHSPHSLHYVGRAIDVSVHNLPEAVVDHICTQAVALGINVYDERERPACGVWTGPHLHLSISPPGTQEL